MFTTHFRSIAAFLLMGLLPAAAQVVQNGKVLWDVCGGEGERPCTPSDPAYPLLPSRIPGLSCDNTLDPLNVNGPLTCSNTGRRRQIKGDPYGGTNPFLSLQLDDQTNSISADLPLNFSSLFGTHNSFSNRVDGNGSELNGDQIFTLSDQLDSHISYVRLDAWLDINGQLILCHSSDLIPSFSIAGQTINIPSGSAACDVSVLGGPMSDHRPPFYAIKEIAYFLKANPGTFLVMRLHDGDGTTANDLRVPIDKELGDLVYKNPFNNISDPVTLANFRWPTLRQFREMTPAKQIVIIGANESDYVWSWTKFVMDDGYSDAPGFKGSCLNQDGQAVNVILTGPYSGAYKSLPRTAEKFSYIGEDRSLSNLFTKAPGAGLLHAADITTAVDCGFNLINVDFLNGLDNAPKLSVGVPGIYDYAFVDYTDGGNPDRRPQSFVWSYSALAPPIPGPVYFINQRQTLDQHWNVGNANSAYPYACAGPLPGQPFPNPDNSWAYDWRVTTQAGVWSQGEDQCQTEFGKAYHFWHPMSAVENANLFYAIGFSGPTFVWMNHYISQVIALPQSLNFTINANQASMESRTIVVSGGHGGALSATFAPGQSKWGQFVDITRTGSNTFLVKPNSILSPFGAGSFSGNLTITEINPVNGQATITGTLISITQSTNAVLVPSPATLNFVSGLTQTVTLTSTTTPIALSLSNAALPSWLKVQLNGSTTPTTATFTADPSKINAGLSGVGVGAATVMFIPTDSNISQQFVTATATIEVERVDTNPTGLAMTVDGAAITTPQKFNWVVGSSHQMLAAQQLTAADQSVYQFGSWSNGAPLSNVVSAPGVLTSYVATYNTMYPLTLKGVPSVGGTLTVLNPQPNNLYSLGMVAVLQPVAAPGYAFKDFSGDLAGSLTPGSLVMTAPRSVQANFILKTGQVKLVTNPGALQIQVDGITYPTPAVFNWDPVQHNVQAPAMQNKDASTRYVFSNWADGIANAARSIGGSGTDVSYTANYNTQYLIDVTVTPSSAGTVTGGGWLDFGTNATLNATPAAGFKFVGFTGALTSTSPSLNAGLVGSPHSFTATFTAIGSPFLYASSGTRTDLGNDMESVPIVLTDVGAGPAGDATITSITGVVATQGGGGVSAALPPGGLNVGTIFSGKTAQGTVQFNWPAAATRIQFTVHYSANGGTYQGSNTISLFR
jgi:hypothetical protein